MKIIIGDIEWWTLQHVLSNVLPIRRVAEPSGELEVRPENRVTSTKLTLPVLKLPSQMLCVILALLSFSCHSHSGNYPHPPCFLYLWPPSFFIGRAVPEWNRPPRQSELSSQVSGTDDDAFGLSPFRLLYQKYYRWGGLNNKYLFHTVLGSESPWSRSQQIWFQVRACFLVHRQPPAHCTLTWLSRVSFIRLLISFMRSPPPITLGIRFQHINFRGT